MEDQVRSRIGWKQKEKIVDSPKTGLFGIIKNIFKHNSSSSAQRTHVPLTTKRTANYDAEADMAIVSAETLRRREGLTW